VLHTLPGTLSAECYEIIIADILCHMHCPLCPVIYVTFEVSHPHCVYHVHRVNEICTRHAVRTQLYYQEVVQSINYMFRPLYWPSSGYIQLYKVTIQYM
jgi:hypothetical protein